MVDRDAFYRRLGLDLSEKKSEAPTEKKGQYSLPALEPMMMTWTYSAIRFEEQKSVEEEEDEIIEVSTPEEAGQTQLFEVQASVASEAENITDDD